MSEQGNGQPELKITKRNNLRQTGGQSVHPGRFVGSRLGRGVGASESVIIQGLKTIVLLK